MDFIISLVVFIVVFFVTYDTMLAINNRGIKLKNILSMNKYVIYLIKVISVFIIIFISSDILDISNEYLKATFIGFTSAMASNIIAMLIKEK
ncbi:hypothetical protein RBH29_09740 [Herbivorax sp. ANBcel31]|uniref:hypothetical protein n=1 Tax=Herbivorax sp. ANBcel31 TaxID=3069754 RepID=UPI0027B3BA3E|nr:hypothetical protein [Herbivorax sp. ANBcel31]MDQ2086706.1 hypothetical protein [Herbivorax sp. ANBcel31]